MDVVPGALFLLLSTAVGGLAENDNNCTSEEFEDCLTILKAISEKDDLALPATRQELHLVCRMLQRGVTCIEDHSFRCFTAAQKRIFNSVVSDSRHVIDDLCVSGKLQDDYLKYAPCLKNVSTDERKCASQYRKLTNNHDVLSSDSKDIDVNDGLKMHCCAFTELVECQHEHLLRDCGPRADQFFQSHLDRMAGSLLNEHCVLFTHGSNACMFNENSGGKNSLINFNLFRNILLYYIIPLGMVLIIQR